MLQDKPQRTAAKPQKRKATETETETSATAAQKKKKRKLNANADVSSSKSEVSSDRKTAAATKEWRIKLTTSSPLYPQSNGQSERAVQTIKNLLKKASEEGRDPYLALMAYRNTPVTGMSYSPAQMLMSRSLNTKVPTLP